MKVWIIAATNRDLGDDVKAVTFREDLFYRVNVLLINHQPVRERAGDIDLLINHFLPESWHIDPEALAIMNNDDSRVNVHELIKVTQRASISADDYGITVDDLPQELTPRSAEI